MRVKDVMTRHPACGTPDTNLYTIAGLMVEKGCGAVPIVKSPETMALVGIVTDRDITCRIVARGDDPMRKIAADCMSSPVITVRLDESLEDCRLAMEHHKVRRIPVIDEDGACCGIVSLADVAEWSQYEESAEVVMAVSHGPRTGSRFAAVS